MGALLPFASTAVAVFMPSEVSFQEITVMKYCVSHVDGRHIANYVGWQYGTSTSMQCWDCRQVPRVT